MKVLKWGLIKVLNVKIIIIIKTFQSQGSDRAKKICFLNMQCNLELIVASVEQRRVINVPIIFYFL